MSGATRAPLVAVTDHAAERYRQRVGSRTGAVDVKLEVVERVARAFARGLVGDEAPDGATGARGSLYARDRGLVFVCRWTGAEQREVVVVTLWEDPAGWAGTGARVGREFTDALKGDDRVVLDRRRDDA